MMVGCQEWLLKPFFAPSAPPIGSRVGNTGLNSNKIALNSACRLCWTWLKLVFKRSSWLCLDNFATLKYIKQNPKLMACISLLIFIEFDLSFDLMIYLINLYK